MSKKYDYRRVPSYRSLKIRDICRIYKREKLSPYTVRSWINDGQLEAMLIGKTYYVYGAALKIFLKNKSEKRKKPLGFEECKCWHCKAVFKLTDKTIKKLSYGKNKGLICYLDCVGCGKEVERPYKHELLDKIIKTFTIEQSEVTVLCDSSCSTRNTNINIEQKKPLREPLKSKPPGKKTESISGSKNTNIEDNQLTLF